MYELREAKNASKHHSSVSRVGERRTLSPKHERAISVRLNGQRWRIPIVTRRIRQNVAWHLTEQCCQQRTEKILFFLRMPRYSITYREI